MKRTLTPSIAFIFILLLSCCGNPNVKSEKQQESESKSGYIYLSVQKLEKLGIFIKDSSVMYNNEMAGVGGLNITIRGMRYIGNAATTEQTTLNFYPRYITTLDTIQRAMYRLEGEHPNDMEEARKWTSFESLVPVVVEQKTNGLKFGETLVFWLTKTPDLEKILADLQKE